MLFTRTCTPLNMVVRPEEKSRSRSEQCIEGCGVVMEMALTRRDEEGQGAAMTGPRSQPEQPEPKQEGSSSTRPHYYCATLHHNTPDIHLLPHPFPPSASRHHVLRFLSSRSSHRVFWPVNAIERARLDCLLKPLHRDHVANRACIIAPLINETWLLPVTAPRRLPPKHSLPPWSS